MFKQKLKSESIGCNLVIKDVTGFYSSVNLEGYNQPNISRTDVTSAVIKITFDSVIEEYDITSIINNGLFNQIDLHTLTEMKDGIYEIEVTLTAVEEYKTKITYVSLCNVRCCVSKLAAKQTDSCNCGSKENKHFINAYLMLKSLENMISCLGEYNFKKQLARLQKLCANSDCNCN